MTPARLRPELLAVVNSDWHRVVSSSDFGLVPSFHFMAVPAVPTLTRPGPFFFTCSCFMLAKLIKSSDFPDRPTSAVIWLTVGQLLSWCPVGLLFGLLIIWLVCWVSWHLEAPWVAAVYLPGSVAVEGFQLEFLGCRPGAVQPIMMQMRLIADRLKTNLRVGW